MDENILTREFGFQMIQPDSCFLTMDKFGLKFVGHVYYGRGNSGYIGKKCYDYIDKYYFIGIHVFYPHSHKDIIAEHYTHFENLGQTLEELIEYLRIDKNFFKPYPLRNKMTEILFDDNDENNYKSFVDDPKNENTCFMCDLVTRNIKGSEE